MKLHSVVVALAGGCAAFAGSASASAQITTRASVSSSGGQANHESWLSAISSDGLFVAFESRADNLVPGDQNGQWDVFVRDVATGTTERVSVDSSGTEGNGWSGTPSISADGRYVAFNSSASNLVPDDVNVSPDIFVRDRWTGTTEIVSVDSQGRQQDFDSWVGIQSISSDGRFVAFHSASDNLVDGDTNLRTDVFVHDRQTGATERVSVDSNGAQADEDCAEPSISADGRFVAFHSLSDNLVPGDTNGCGDVFVHDRETGVTERVSVDTAGVQGDDLSVRGFLSGDGSVVAFQSYATNLVAGDGNGRYDVFVRDRAAGTTELVSVDSAGVLGNGDSCDPSLSADGRWVAFASEASNLDPRDGTRYIDVFVHDRQDGTTRLASVSTTGVHGNNSSPWIAISPDGRYASFTSLSWNLVSGDSNSGYDVFRRDLGVAATWNNYGDGFPGTLGVPDLTAESNPQLGTTERIDAGNSSDRYAIALLLVGLSQNDFVTGKGGTLLVDPLLAQLLILDPWGPLQLDFDIPYDPSLDGVHAYMQTIEQDDGAAQGLSFSRGLDLMLGT